MDYHIKTCDEAQLPEIMEIFNEAIINTSSVYDYNPRTMDDMMTWYYAKIKGDYPLIGLFDQHENLLGFGTYGTFRGQPAYKYSIEHSVYVRTDVRGNGLGKVLLTEVIKRAILDDYHVIVGGIDSGNATSIRLHDKMGFKFSGTVKHAGYKFGKWLDLSFYQLILKTPLNPIEE